MAAARQRITVLVTRPENARITKLATEAGVAEESTCGGQR
jgi:hypothetical protein